MAPQGADVFDMLDSIARPVGRAMEVCLSGHGEHLVLPGHRSDHTAQALYLQGPYGLSRRTPDGPDEAVAFFAEGLDRDPAWVQALLGLDGHRYPGVRAPHDAGANRWCVAGAKTTLRRTRPPQPPRVQAGPTLPRGSWSAAKAINDRGPVVGLAHTPEGTRAFLQEKGVVTNLGTLPGETSRQATGINARSQVVGSSHGGALGGTRAFPWEDCRMTELTLSPPRTSSVAEAINNRGEINGEVRGAGALRPVEPLNRRGKDRPGLYGSRWSHDRD